MNGRIVGSFLVIALAFFLFAALGGGCANPIAPTGGPRDSLPPVLVSVTPKDSSENFNAKRVSFSFNEFVELDNIRGNLVVSPVPKVDPVVESKLRTVTIRIKDTLEPNTTYAYNFGRAIKDINEGNVLKNFTYVFSTGAYIDSLELSGRVILARTGKPDSTLIVMLHRNPADSAVMKEKPRFIAKLDSAGYFHFRHLPPGTFSIYALQDESGQKKYLQRSQLFGFADKPIVIGPGNPPVKLYAYLEKDEEKPKTTITPIVKPKPDKSKEQDKRLKFAMTLENGQQDLLSNLHFTFPDPLKKFDSTKVIFADEAFHPIQRYRLFIDTSNRVVTLAYKWPEDTKFNLIFDRDFAEDSSGRKIARTDTLRFKTAKESEYGNINIRFNNLDLSKKPVLQLLQADVVKDSARLTSRDFFVKLFKPGEYEMRILYDDNGNGTWDPGQFFVHRRQPEKVISIKRPLVIKANWDNDNSIDIVE